MRLPAISSTLLCSLLACVPLLACVSGDLEGLDGEREDHGSPAAFDVEWQLSDSECPENSSLHILSLLLDSNEEVSEDIFPCTTPRALTAELTSGNYAVWAEIRTDDGLGLFAQSESQEVALGSNGTVAVHLPAFPLDSGFLGFTWSLVDSFGSPISCEDAGADGVEIIATVASTAEAFDDIFDCDLGSASALAPVGAHTVVVGVLDDVDPLGTSMPRDTEITFGNELVDLGNFEFSF